MASGAMVAFVCLLVPALAEAEMERALHYDINAKATNGYRLNVSAFRTTVGGGTATLAVSNGTASASYVQRSARVTRHRISADFGDLGSLSYRFNARGKQTFDVGRRDSRCELQATVRFGTLKGHFEFDGEGGYTRARAGSSGGYSLSLRDRRCRGERDSDLFRAPEQDRTAVLSTCGAQSGVGFFAFEEERGGESGFLVSKTERTGELDIYRLLSLEGPAKGFDVGPGMNSAVVRPPSPITGEGRYRSGLLRGNLRASLPGAEDLWLSPSRGKLQHRDEFMAHPPKCYPDVFLYGGGFGYGPRVIFSSRAMTGNAIARAALTPGARRLLVPELPPPFPRP